MYVCYAGLTSLVAPIVMGDYHAADLLVGEHHHPTAPADLHQGYASDTDLVDCRSTRPFLEGLSAISPGRPFL
jgi:ligand-binding sensor protein